MVSEKVARRVTAQEFLTHPAARGPSELIRGEVRVLTPASGAHGVVAGVIFRALSNFVEANNLGLCLPDNTGFQLPGLADTVRSPDAAFVRADRLPEKGIGSGWISVAPDLAIEIISPTETAASLEDKLADYRAAGTTLIWVIDPSTRSVSVRRAGAPEQRLTERDSIDGANVLPGFALPVAKLFERLAP